MTQETQESSSLPGRRKKQQKPVSKARLTQESADKLILRLPITSFKASRQQQDTHGRVLVSHDQTDNASDEEGQTKSASGQVETGVPRDPQTPIMAELENTSVHDGPLNGTTQHVTRLKDKPILRDQDENDSRMSGAGQNELPGQLAVRKRGHIPLPPPRPTVESLLESLQHQPSGRPRRTIPIRKSPGRAH